MEFLGLLGHDPSSPLLFNSGTFFLLFTVFLAGYALVLPKQAPRTLYVLLFSLYYYYRCNGLFAGALVVTTILDFGLSRRLADEGREPVRKAIVATSVILNLGILGYFKYANFFLENVSLLTGETIPRLDIFLPIGISFYTFQSLSYVIDVYREDVEPTDDLLTYAFYLSFFPQIVAGPIVRARDFLPQIAEPRIDREQVGEGLFLVLRGLAKKALLADYVAIFVDLVFAQPSAYHGLEVWVAVYGYAVQIYFDFSGYSDIAIGMARILGFRFPDNFDAPYRATSVTEFWQRWHISLSTWLRDYLYIPLGGNRGGKLRRDRNLMITMLLGGLWHGASWNFVLWGGLHGTALVVDKRLEEARAAAPTTALRRWAAGLLTFHFVCGCWILFRATDLGTATAVFQQLATLPAGIPYLPTVWAARQTVFAVVALALALCFVPPTVMERLREGFVRAPIPVKAVALLTVLQGVIQLELTEVQPFIYFQF